MSEKKQVAKNLIANVISLVFRLLVGLWLVPYLVSHIGTAAYGFVPVASVLTEYLSIVTGALQGAISRFLSIHLQKEEFKDANKVFNTALFGFIFIIILQIPIFYGVLLYADQLFTIPDELYRDVMLLFVLTIISFSITLIVDIVGVPLFAFNRIDLMRILNIVRYATRVLVVVVLFTVDTPKLFYVGVGELVASFVGGVLTVYYSRKLSPWLSVKISDFDKSRLKELVTMSGWIVINYLGFLLFIRTDTPLVNSFIGAKEAGEYAAVVQWSILLRSVVSMLAFLAAPLILAAYSKNDYAKIENIVIRSMKILGVFTSIVTGLIMAQAESLLGIWVGHGIEKLYPLLILTLVHLPINLSIIPVDSLWPPLNKVKIPGIVTLATGITTLLLSVILIKYTDLGVYGVALAGLIVLSFKSVIFTPIYASRVLKISPRAFYTPLVKIVLSTIVVFGIGYTTSFFVIDSWFRLIGSSAILGIVALPILWRLILTKEDRDFAVNLVPERFRNRIPGL